jgi:beta-lactamase class C
MRRWRSAPLTALAPRRPRREDNGTVPSISRRGFLFSPALLRAAVLNGRIQEADALIRRHADSGFAESAALLVRHPDGELAAGYGKATANSPFLIASITKPMTCAAVLLLRDRGQLKLEDRVRRYLPEFNGGGRDLMTIRHLLTHTSGLPDMLPENDRLRAQHQPLESFVAAACRTPLLFEPGSRVSYQSMGILLAAEIVQRLTGQPFRQFLASEVFLPCGLTNTALGLGQWRLDQVVRCQVAQPNSWDWNSPYWRDLGAPWGGAHSTTRDIARFLELFASEARPWKPGTLREMVTLQTPGMKEAWGLGLRLQPGKFGRACSAETWGHSGSTGTVSWHDARRKLTFVLLTSRPAAESGKPLLDPVSDLASEAV